MYTYETKKKRGKIVDLSRCSMKKIRELIVFTAFLVVALWKFDVVIEVLKSIWKIVFQMCIRDSMGGDCRERFRFFYHDKFSCE